MFIDVKCMEWYVAIAFNNRFRQVLWNEVDLESAEKEVTFFNGIPAHTNEIKLPKHECKARGQGSFISSSSML